MYGALRVILALLVVLLWPAAVLSEPVGEASPRTAQTQRANDRLNPAAKLLDRTTEKQLIAAIADLGWVRGSSDVFHAFSAMKPGGLCEHVNRILVQITKIGIEDCLAEQRKIIDLDDLSQSTSEKIHYYALNYNHVSFEEFCDEGCQETEPFSRHILLNDEYYCGISLYHIFRDAGGKEYRIIGDLDARKYPYICFS